MAMKKDRKCTRLFVVAVTEFLMMYTSLLLIRQAARWLATVCTDENVLAVADIAFFIIPIVMCLLYMRITYPEKLSIFREGGAKKSTGSFATGVVVGFLLNIALCVLGAVSGSVRYVFIGFNPLLIVAFVTCFIECASEDVLIKGYVSSYLEDNYSYDVIAFAGSVLMVLHHIGSLEYYDFDALFCLNIFLLGVVLFVAVKITNNIWTAFGMHTAWSYTQEFIFGGESSGMKSPMALFSSVPVKDTFFFDKVYGNEGTYMCTVLLIIAIAVLCAISCSVSHGDVSHDSNE